MIVYINFFFLTFTYMSLLGSFLLHSWKNLGPLDVCRIKWQTKKIADI